MERIQELSTFLLWVVPVGASARIGYCFLAMQLEEDTSQLKKRIINTLIFTALAECFSGLMPMFLGYFT